jgi:uncharacterized protein YkwD
MIQRYPFPAFALLVALGLLTAAAAEQADPKFKISKEEQEIIDLTNLERAKEKLPPLKPNPLLFDNAKVHSGNMAKHRKVAHVFDKKGPDDRADDAGYDYMVINENIGWFPVLTGKAVVPDGFMTSKVHRDNILGRDYDDIGIGIVPGNGPDPQGNLKGFWVTQVFGRERKKP